ncbi:MAG: ATP-binding protein [Trueperaceae bacterium]
MKTLHARLVVALLALIIPLSVLFVLTILMTSQRYYQEITQQLNVTLAKRIVAEENDLTMSEQIEDSRLDNSARMVAMTNPGLEIYLVDYAGTIRGSSIAMDAIVRKKVELQPIYDFLTADVNFPILGTDPRHPIGKKIFSVARLEPPIGYLYVILADASRDSVIRMVQNSTVLKVSLWVSVTALITVFAFGIWIFAYLTRRLRRLSKTMSAFRDTDFVLTDRVARITPKDELDGLQNIFADMSERISEQMQDLRQVDALRRELITNISHDLRTPLAALQGYLETLQLKAATLTEDERKHYILAASKHSERLGKLISDLFDLSRLEAKAVEVRPEPFLLQELAQDIVLKFEAAATAKGVELALNADRGLTFVHADVGLMERALTNLIENALRYTPTGGEVRLELRNYNMRNYNNGVQVRVVDTGQGIAADELPYIFERFYRARGNDEKTGSGLGLAIVKRILELHGEEIKVSSVLQRGTTFSFHVPAAV